MDQQQKVMTFIQDNDMESPAAYRLLDLVSELGEVAKDATESTEYGSSPESININADEIGDMLFALHAFADSVGIDSSDALDEALAKYEQRLTDYDSAASGN